MDGLEWNGERDEWMDGGGRRELDGWMEEVEYLRFPTVKNSRHRL